MSEKFTYRSLFQSLTEAVIISDENGHAIDCNPAALELFDCTRERFLGSTPVDWSPECQPCGRRSDEMAREIITQVLQGKTLNFDWTNKRSDGSIIEVGVTITAIQTHGALRIIAVSRDISSRKKAEAKLVKSEEHFRAMFDRAPLAYQSLDMSAKILDVNDAWLNLLGGINREEAIGRSITDFIEEHSLPTLAQNFPAFIQRGHVEGPIFDMRCSNGEQRTVMVNGRIGYDEEGNAQRTHCILTDVTERIRHEEELSRYHEQLTTLVHERTQELQAKNLALQQTLSQLKATQNNLIEASKLASLGELVAGVSHELNTPIGNARAISTTIYGQSRDFLKRFESGDIRRSELDGFLRQVNEGCLLLDRNLTRASELIQSFKQVAVDRAGSQRRLFDLRKVTEEIIATLLPTLSKTPYRLDIDIPSGIQLDSFPGAFGQVIVNLIENALTHGLAEKTSGTIHVQGSEVSNDIELIVADDGCGIPEANLARVFDPFFTTRFGSGGSGLGLNIVYSIVNGLLGGAISVSSAAGQGATFNIKIPRCAPQRDNKKPSLAQILS
jgi:PAS domain S-box-containing protein